MALSKKQAQRVAKVMAAQIGKEEALDLMDRINKAAYGKKPAKSLRSFRRIISALSKITKLGGKKPRPKK
jgi:hypothetical protein